MKEDKTSLMQLFISFAKVGLLTFGGGPAMLPMLEREVVNRRGWTSEDELLEYYAIGQCTPGIIAVNTATFTGYRQRGIAGGIVATLGIVFPSFVIITILAAFFSKFRNNPYILKAFAGIRISVTALMTSSVFKLAEKAIKSFESLVIAAVTIICELILGISPVFIVILCLFYGICVFYHENRKKGARK